MRYRHQGDVVIPAGVGPALDVIETERVFESVVIVLDTPAYLRDADKLAEVGVGGG